jgi:hypothetical protein
MCCSPSSLTGGALTKSIKDSPSNTLEDHRDFHLHMLHSNTLKISYLINLNVNHNSTGLAALKYCKSRSQLTGRS